MRLIQKGMQRVLRDDDGSVTVREGSDFHYFDPQEVEHALFEAEEDEELALDLLLSRSLEQSRREGDPKWIAADRRFLLQHRAVTATVNRHRALGLAFAPRAGRAPRRAARRAVARAGPSAPEPPPAPEPPGRPASRPRRPS